MNDKETAIAKIISDELSIEPSEVTDIIQLKNGMTNYSYVFCYKRKKYIIRIPGEGTEQLINRKREADVYRVICKKGLCDNVLKINPQTGCKITEYYQNATVCNPLNAYEVGACMKRLRQFHEMGLKVDHEFDLFEQILFYEKLRTGKASVYEDYKETRNHIFELKEYIEQNVEKKVLSHIDAVPDNFLFAEDNGKETIRLIDWEYAGMQDPHIDIAMFAIYSNYDKNQVDWLISNYFQGDCGNSIRIKIYCYIAAGGLLWSNWCEYKHMQGIDFGSYALKQYQYAKKYYQIVKNELRIKEYDT